MEIFETFHEIAVQGKVKKGFKTLKRIHGREEVK